MRRRCRLAAAVPAAICTVLAGAWAPGASASPPRSFALGITDGLFENGPNAATWLTRAANDGAQVVLLPVDWASIAAGRPKGDQTNPVNPGYDWGRLDQSVRNAVARGLTVAFTVAGGGGGPAWADGPHKPRNAAPGTWRPSASSLGAFATALARRYSGSFNPGNGTLPHVRYYQAWSEPNLSNHLTPQWVRQGKHWVAESPVIYRGLLNAFYAGVKSVSKSDSVITGGTAPFGDAPGGSRVPPALFVKTLLCLSDSMKPLSCPNPAHFDVLAHHPYATAGPFQKAFNADDVSLPDLSKLTRPLSVAERTGRALPRGRKQLWVTEFSWDTRPPDPHGIPALERARWMDQAFWELWREGVDTLCWYLMVDAPPVPSYATTYQSGLYYRNGKPKSGLQAFRFPFVVQSIGHGRWQVWGITPDSGKVLVQRRVGSSWKTLFEVQRRAHAIFARTIGDPGHAPMRARVGSEDSLSFSP